MPPKRVQVSIPEDDTLPILCCEPSSQPIAQTLAAYARAVEYATASVSQTLSRNDWNYLADCLNGCWHVQDLSGLSARTVLRAEAEDAHRISRLGEKWYECLDVEASVQALLLTLAGMSETEAQAILLAVRHFWAHPKIDHTTEEWWTIRHRISPRAR